MLRESSFCLRMLTKLTIVLVLWCTIATSYAAKITNDAGVTVDWGYRGNRGPVHWGELSPAFILCNTGTMQSPINIPKRVSQVTDDLTFDYQAAPLVLLKDGNTALQLGAQQTIIDDGHTIQVNFPATKEVIHWHGVPYQLVQWHIHTPSENQWRGRAYPLELHLVHQGPHGQVLVIGIFVASGQMNPVLQMLIDHAPVTSKQEMLIPGSRSNPMDLLPAVLDHYRFQGSLTTPPCTEGLQWIVMAKPITATPGQLMSIRHLIGGSNARPLQALRHRPIFYVGDTASGKTN